MYQEKYSHDVVIVGAGPAGAAAAILCAKAGLRVALLESERFPRHRPGESLHPGIEPLWKELGVLDDALAAGFLRYEGIWIEDRNGSRFDAFGSGWLGFQAPREQMDAILLDRAVRSGAMVYQSSHAVRPILDGSRVVGVISSDAVHEARFVLDASGDRRWLSRALGLRLLTYSPPLLAQYGYLTGQSARGEGNPKFTFQNEGWLWTARIGAARYHFTRLIISGEVNAPRIPPEFADLTLEGPVRVKDVTWRISERCSGPGYFLLGDAAAVLDPASSHGVLRAILSGFQAAFWIRHVFNGLSETIADREYDRWMRELFEHDTKYLRALDYFPNSYKISPWQA